MFTGDSQYEGGGDTAARPSKCAGICILLYRDTHKREIFFRKKSTGLSAKSQGMIVSKPWGDTYRNVMHASVYKGRKIVGLTPKDIDVLIGYIVSRISGMWCRCGRSLRGRICGFIRMGARRERCLRSFARPGD